MRKLQLSVDFVLALAVGVWMIWLIAGVPPAQIEAGAWAQKIFYLHVPSATVGFFGFFLVALMSLGVLLRKTKIWDTGLCAGVGISYVFSTAVIVTGPFWARPVWGVWWRWEPRLTTFFIMWLMYSGWFLFRRSLPPGRQKEVYSAIYALLAFLNVPVIMSSIYLWSVDVQLHPRRENLSMDPSMQYTFYASLIMMGLIFLRLFWFGFDVERYIRRWKERSLGKY